MKPRTSSPAWPRCLLALALPLAAARAQSVRVEVGPDPYTGGEADALAAAGYVSLGPFEFGTNHNTATVAELLGTEPLAWIETAHFRIGCALSPLEVKGKEEWSRDWIDKTRRELTELKKLLPRVNPRAKVLDPWLRAHLTAWRLEQLYAEVLANLGLREEWFPKEPGDPRDPEHFRGLGPYLGMQQKYEVLLLRRSASHARYTRAFQGQEIGEPIRYHDGAFGCMYWGASEETADGLFAIDMALHAHLVFNVAHNLYTGYRAFGHDLPAWLSIGLGHWHARRVSPRFPTYDRRDDSDRDPRSAFWEWDQRVWGMTKHGVFEPLATFLERDKPGEFGLEQHIESWALVDFLLTTKKAATFRFLHQLKAPFHGRTRFPTPQELQTRQRDALRDAFDCDAAGLEQQWRDHVLAQRRR